ncbi:MAG: CsgG/HfaB family protein [Spirochaetia bacterium]|jgi:hypothetical protein|nr:CsgG/HfaB family protein [Spirochaetia bacterium]
MGKTGIGVLGVLAVVAFAACLSAPQQAAGPARQVPRTNLSAAAGADESEIIIQRGPDNQTQEFVGVFVDGILSAEVAPNSSEKLILPNGPHSVSVTAIGKTSSTLRFQARSSRFVFKASIAIAAFSSVILTKESEVSLDPASAANILASVPGADSLPQAVALAARAIAEDLPEKSRVAIMNIGASSASDGEFAVDELTSLLVNMKKFSMVDRHSLEAVLAEQDLHMSGMVDDDSVISVGRLAGAEIILTGSISGFGDNRRLTVKALDVQSGEIRAMSSQKF